MAQRGIFVPAFDVLSDPVVLADVAADAELAGWDAVFVWDHLLYAEPVREVADPWVAMAAIAARTERVLLGPMVTPLARRRPQVLARQAVTLDRLSGGRLVLGFGLGDDGGVGELSRFGEELDARVRAAMLDEGLDLLRDLLSGAVVDHDGEHWTARGVQLLPAQEVTPQRLGGIPFWVAGRWPNRAPVRRAARFEGYFPIGLDGAAQVGEVLEAVAAARAQADAPVGDGAGDDGGAPADDVGAAPFDVVVDVPAGTDPAPWADAGASWVLTRLGPYHLDLAEVRRVVRAGPA